MFSASISLALAGSPAVTAENVFTDVPSTAAYADAVAWAHQKGVVNGVSADRFSPSASITREQISAMFLRYAKVAGADTAITGSLSDFSDAAAVSSYAVDSMRWCVGAGLINGTTTTTLSPKGTATRCRCNPFSSVLSLRTLPSGEGNVLTCLMSEAISWSRCSVSCNRS